MHMHVCMCACMYRCTNVDEVSTIFQQKWHIIARFYVSNALNSILIIKQFLVQFAS